MDQLIQFVKNHWELCLAFAAIVIVLIFEEIRRNAGGIKRLSTQDLTAMINHDNAVVVDLRTLEEFRKGHILNAINIAETNVDAISNRLEQYKDRPIIIIHNSETAATNIVNKISKNGFNLYTLAGGFDAWIKASLPVVKK